MKNKFLTVPLLLSLLTACTTQSYFEKVYKFFDATLFGYQYEGEKNYLTNINDIFYYLNNDTDNYKAHGKGIYEINQDNNVHEISKDLYDLLNKSLIYQDAFGGKFNIFVGSLAKKWQESLDNKLVLPPNVISEEVNKIRNTSLELSISNGVYTAKRIGEAEIDLGAIAKGYALDLAKDVFINNGVNKYLINGISSILLGENIRNSGDFRIDFNDIEGKCFYAKNTFIGTSGTTERGVTIDGVTYSHIVNPITGSVINNYDMAYVIANNGALADALSTTFMISTVDEVKSLVDKFGAQALLYNDGEIVYKTEGFVIKDING